MTRRFLGGRQTLIVASTISALWLAATTIEAAPGFARPFADHMVLQRGMPVPVWGTADPGAAVVVRFAGQSVEGVADGQGRWWVRLAAMSASTTPHDLSLHASEQAPCLVRKNIVVGEVWLAAGQSNMDFPVSGSGDRPDPEHDDLIRMCNWRGTVGADARTLYGPTEFVNLTAERFYIGTWQRLTDPSVRDQSAVACFFARALARELRGTAPGGGDVPVGVFELAVGGTCTEAFIPPAELKAEPRLRAAFEDPRGVLSLGQWTSGRIAANLDGYVHPDLDDPHPHPYAPGFLYRTGIRHLVPFAFRGVIWYQGESNAEFTTEPYRWTGEDLSRYQAMVMRTLIRSWREIFQSPNLPFYMVQLPRISAPNRVLWPWYREAQQLVSGAVPDVELAVVPEFGSDGADVHPRNKAPVGERLAYIARNRLYGQDVPYSGPQFTSSRLDGSKMVLAFDHVEDGLISLDGEPLRHFEVAGADRVFVPATARIVGDTVEVSAPTVRDPFATRYGWHMNIDVNFYNTNPIENLPAAPFRTAGSTE